MNPLSSIKPVNWIKTAFHGLLLFGIYYSSISYLIINDWAREDYSSGYLIPFVVLYLIWEKRTALEKLPSIPSWNGFWLLCTGIFLFWLGELGGEYFTLYISSWLVLVGLCWLHLGWKKIKEISFALVFCLAMFPLPNFLYGKVSFQLKLISSKLGVAMMQLYGMTAYREGNIIDIGVTQLQVVDACSGLRYLIPLLILGILLAYFFKAAFWKKALLVISTIPLTIVTNSMRIALTGLLSEIWSREAAQGFFHGFSGWFIFMFTLGVLLIEMWVLKKILPEKSSVIQSPELKAESKEKGEVTEAQIQNSKFKIQNFFSPPPQFVVAVLLLGATLAFSRGVEFREKVPINKSFDQFPLQLGEWSGTRQNMEQRFIDKLDLSDYAIIDYKNKHGKKVNFYVAYYESQRKGESIHSPATCLPGGGWEFNQAGKITIPVQTHKSDYMPVNRALMRKGDRRQLSFYWFPQRGRILTNAYQLKLFGFWDALTRQRTDGALVRVITTVYESEDPEEAEKRLQEFTKDIVPVLNEYIPK